MPPTCWTKKNPFLTHEKGHGRLKVDSGWVIFVASQGQFLQFSIGSLKELLVDMQVALFSTCYIFYSVFCWKDRPMSFPDRTLGFWLEKAMELVCVNAVQTDNVFGLEINP